MKFKVGDKVKCVYKDFGQSLIVGDIYTVKVVTLEIVSVEELPGRYWLDKFELAHENKFEPGDRVEYSDNWNGAKAVGTVRDTIYHKDHDTWYVSVDWDKDAAFTDGEGWGENQLRKIKEEVKPTTKFKVGDRVKFVNAGGAPKLQTFLNKTATITRTFDEDWLDVKWDDPNIIGNTLGWLDYRFELDESTIEDKVNRIVESAVSDALKSLENSLEAALDSTRDFLLDSIRTELNKNLNLNL